jgi:hypothetical protein
MVLMYSATFNRLEITTTDKKKIYSDQNTENMKFTCGIHSHTKSSDITL